MAIINQVIKRRLLERAVRVFFVSGAVTKWYNAQRQDKTAEVCLLGGWYWSHGREERGPFRTPSGAQRDAYYRLLLKQAPPGLDEDEVAAAQREIAQSRKAGERLRQRAAAERRIG